MRLETPNGVERRDVRSAREMQAIALELAASADVFISVAAVADYRPAQVSTEKLKKLDAPLSLELVRNPDILADLGAARGSKIAPVLVGFAAETENLVENARSKLLGKKCDLIVANDVSDPEAGFGVDTNKVILVRDGSSVVVPLASKLQVAHAILEALETKDD